MSLRAVCAEWREWSRRETEKGTEGRGSRERRQITYLLRWKKRRGPQKRDCSLSMDAHCTACDQHTELGMSLCKVCAERNGGDGRETIWVLIPSREIQRGVRGSQWGCRRAVCVSNAISGKQTRSEASHSLSEASKLRDRETMQRQREHALTLVVACQAARRQPAQPGQHRHGAALQQLRAHLAHVGLSALRERAQHVLRGRRARG